MQGSFTYACKSIDEFRALCAEFASATTATPKAIALPPIAPSGSHPSPVVINVQGPREIGPKEREWVAKTGKAKMSIGKNLRAFMESKGLVSREDLAGYYLTYGQPTLGQGGESNEDEDEAPAVEIPEINLDQVPA